MKEEGRKIFRPSERSERSSVGPSRKVSTSWEQLIQQSLDFLSLERGLSANTMTDYRQDLDQLEQGMDLKAPTSVTRPDVQEHLMQLRDEQLTASSVARKLVAIKMFYRFLLAQGILRSDPTEVFESPRLLKGLPDV